MKRYIFTLILVSVLLAAVAQIPQWANKTVRDNKFSLEKFYVGYAEQIISKNDDIQNARMETLDAAKAELIESISVTIMSKSETFKNELVNIAEENKPNFDFQSDFKSWTESVSENTLNDLQQMEPEFDKKSKKVYALVYVEKREILLKNKGVIDKNLLKITSKVESAKTHITKSNELDALELLIKTGSAFVEIEQAQSMVFITSDATYKQKEYLELKNSVFNLYKQIENSTDLSIDEACKLVVDDLKYQLNVGFDQTMILTAINYGNGENISPFSQRFQRALGLQLIKSNFQLANNFNDVKQLKKYVEIEGAYYEEEDVIKVFITMIGEPTGQKIAASSALISKEWLDKNDIDYVPQEVLEIKKRIKERESLLKETSYGGIEFSFWTNKKGTDPTFKEGEDMKLYIQVSKPCWIRGLYFQADGLTTYPFKDFYVSDERVGQILDLEEMRIAGFVMGAPFGKEDLLIAVSEKPFIDLNIEKREIIVDGDKYELHVISDDDFTAISTTKGMYNKFYPGEIVKSSYYAQKSLSLEVVPGNE